jgi:hypothetical protein
MRSLVLAISRFTVGKGRHRIEREGQARAVRLVAHWAPEEPLVGASLPGVGKLGLA